jgi:DnaJ-class molecular chaperone
MADQKIPCPACHGTGQWTFFGGVSRFFFTVEECPECGGLGFIMPPDEATPKGTPAKGATTRRRKK